MCLYMTKRLFLYMLGLCTAVVLLYHVLTQRYTGLPVPDRRSRQGRLTPEQLEMVVLLADRQGASGHRQGASGHRLVSSRARGLGRVTTGDVILVTEPESESLPQHDDNAAAYFGNSGGYQEDLDYEGDEPEKHGETDLATKFNQRTLEKYGRTNASKLDSTQLSQHYQQSAPESPEANGEELNHRYVIRSFLGRLGNVLFELATALCIARHNNMSLLLQHDPNLDLLNLTSLGHVQVASDVASLHLHLKQVHRSVGCQYRTDLWRLAPDRHHVLQGYFQSWRYFQPCRQLVLAATTFPPTVTDAARDVLQRLRQQHEGATLVGVHVRMEDIANQLRNHGRTVADRNYYLRAMAYFRKRYPDVRFVVIASSPDWFRREVTADDDVVMLTRSSSPEVDMEVLSRLDHIIISVGTFGWWAAYRKFDQVQMKTGSEAAVSHMYLPQLCSAPDNGCEGCHKVCLSRQSRLSVQHQEPYARKGGNMNISSSEQTQNGRLQRLATSDGF